MVYDPPAGKGECQVPIHDRVQWSLIRVLDLQGNPLPGVSVDCGEVRIGETDHLGHLHVETDRVLYDYVRVGADNPELIQRFPVRERIELGVDTQYQTAGHAILMDPK